MGSKEASELALEIRQLEQAYGEAGETIGEFHQRIEDLSESLSNIDETYSENMKSAEDLYGSSIMLIGQLQALQNQTSLTDQELILMKQIVSELNGSYSDLGLSINETTGKPISQYLICMIMHRRSRSNKNGSCQQGIG